MRNILFSVLSFLSFGASLAQGSGSKVDFVEPVRLAGYASGVSIEWSTSNEKDVDYYAVYRHAGDRSGLVAALEPRGSVDSINAYRYIDQSKLTADVQFELRAVFFDGTYAASDLLEASAALGTRMRILSALDSESLARLHIRVDTEVEREVVLRIKTLAGEILETQNRTLNAGENDVEVDYMNWPSGYYAIALEGAGTQREWLVEVDPSVPRATTRQITRRR